MANNYWIARSLKQQDILYDKTLQESQQQLMKVYKEALNDVKDDITSLYLKLIKTAEDIKINDLYRYNRFYNLHNKINRVLSSLGNEEKAILNKRLLAMYQGTIEIIASNLSTTIIIGDKRVEAVLNSVWCADGKHWSNRIWSNKAQLQQRIEKGLVDCVARGVPKDEIVKQLIHDFEVGFSQADRIVRTELTYCQNQACADSYKVAGATKYKYLAADDSRTSEICSSLDGKIFNMKDMQVGVNCPPMHPHCRSTITAVFD